MSPKGKPHPPPRRRVPARRGAVRSCAVDILIELFGWLGAIVLLSAFMLLSAECLQSRSTYQCMNLFGALGVALSSAYAGSYPAAALNLFWMIAAAATLVRIRRSRTGGLEIQAEGDRKTKCAG